jgi:hypothetical protein
VAVRALLTVALSRLNILSDYLDKFDTYDTTAGDYDMCRSIDIEAKAVPPHHPGINPHPSTEIERNETADINNRLTTLTNTDS